MMTGSKHVLHVYLAERMIAELLLVDDQLHWHYQRDWQQTGYPVSPYLPFNEEIPALNIQRFLRNYLPEGYALEELLQMFHLSKSNTFGLIRALGLDISGALIFKDPSQSFSTAVSFRPISEDELQHRLDHRDLFSLLIWDGKPRLSVAGIQDKINVAINEDNQLGFGEGDLCSTHILKFETKKLTHLVLNEYITMQLAKQCDLNVANTKLMYYGDNPALLVERFDRQIVSATKIKRRHLIDGCQALNLPPDYKYERNFGSGRDVAHIRDGVSLEQLFKFAKQCENPAHSMQSILDWVLFNLLIFNFDAHGKNISFFVGAKGLELTPFYDLVNIKMYPQFEHELAMAFGDEFDGENMNAYQLAEFSDTCQLPRSFVANRLILMIKKLQAAIHNWSFKMSSDDEKRYLQQYKKIVSERCCHLLKEADDIVSMNL